MPAVSDEIAWTVRLYPQLVVYHRWRGPGELLLVVCDRRFDAPAIARVDGGDPGDEDGAP